MDVRRFGYFGLVITVLFVVWGTSANAQLVTVAKEPQLSLGVASGAPEAPTEVALKLRTPPGVAVGRVEATVTFPSALEFSEVTGYPISEKVVKVETKVANAADGQRTLTLSLQPVAADQPLPSEVIVNLVFKVAKEAKTGVLDVKLQAKAFSPDAKPVAGLKVFDGRVNIQEADLFFACFFYMH